MQNCVASGAPGCFVSIVFTRSALTNSQISKDWPDLANSSAAQLWYPHTVSQDYTMNVEICLLTPASSACLLMQFFCFFFRIAEEFDMSTVDGWGALTGSECGSSVSTCCLQCVLCTMDMCFKSPSQDRHWEAACSPSVCSRQQSPSWQKKTSLSDLDTP